MIPISDMIPGWISNTNIPWKDFKNLIIIFDKIVDTLIKYALLVGSLTRSKIPGFFETFDSVLLLLVQMFVSFEDDWIFFWCKCLPQNILLKTIEYFLVQMFASKHSFAIDIFYGCRLPPNILLNIQYLVGSQHNQIAQLCLLYLSIE